MQMLKASQSLSVFDTERYHRKASYNAFQSNNGQKITMHAIYTM